jgi:hypothetical protein
MRSTLVADMRLYGKVEDIFTATILPHEGRQIDIGGSSLYVLRFSGCQNSSVALLVSSSIDQRDAFTARCVARWLCRARDSALKILACPQDNTVLVSASQTELDSIEGELMDRGAEIHSIDYGSDFYGSVITVTVRALISQLDINQPEFRTSLSAETERLADLGVFNSTAGGDIRDTLLLSSWVASRLRGRLGNLSSLELLSFGDSSPSAVSPLVENWIDDLFGSDREFYGLDIVPISRSFGDLLTRSEDASIVDGHGMSSQIKLGFELAARCGTLSHSVEVSTRHRMLTYLDDRNSGSSSTGSSGLKNALVIVNVDVSDGAVVQVAEGAELLIIELHGKSLNQYKSGDDPVVGFYNQLGREWEYLDELGNVVSSPVLEAPYYSPDIGNTSTIVMRVKRSVQATPIPAPAIRDIKLVLLFSGPVADNFDVKIRQFNVLGDMAYMSDIKWPANRSSTANAEPIDRVNFVAWQPFSGSSCAIYRIETLNHTLWDADSTDMGNYNTLTANFGEFRSLIRKFSAWREMSG